MTARTQAWSAVRPLILGGLTLILLVGGGVGWACLTRIAGAIVVPGQIEVAQSRQIVQHPDGGIVSEIRVSEGSRVIAGEVLLRLDGSALQSEMAIAETRLQELSTRRARLEAQRDNLPEVAFPDAVTAAAASSRELADLVAGQVRLFELEARALSRDQALRKAHVDQIEREIAGLRERGNAIEHEIALLEAELSSLRDLAEQGLAPTSRISERERELARLKGWRGELSAARAAAEGRITLLEIETATRLARRDAQIEVDLREVLSSQLELAERRRALAVRIAGLDLVAPASGIVLKLAVATPNAVIRPAETVLEIVPQDQPLLAAVRVPLAHVDEVHIGQNVNLVFPTLPARGAPALEGRVTLVSAGALVDERTGEGFFRAEVALNPLEMQQLAEVAILPGMPVSALLLTEDRTPLSYLVKPVTDYFRAAFRES